MSLWCSLTYDIYDEYCSEEEAFAVGIVHVMAYVVLTALLIGNRGRLQEQLGLEKTACAMQTVSSTPRYPWRLREFLFSSSDPVSVLTFYGS